MDVQEHKKRRYMGKRNLIFTQKICQVTKDTALSHYHNRLLYEFSKIKECEVLKKPPCCRTVCLSCFHSHNITEKTIRIKKRVARRRSSFQIDQVFICKLCGAKEVSRGFVPKEHTGPVKKTNTSQETSVTETKKKTKKKKKSKMNIVKAETFHGTTMPIITKPMSSVNTFATFMSSLC
ncbi:unnamed protein product [Schistosoma rodhaini]|uniref:Uncharacterized protein n=1 Tax=Schistosoma rodhaini TaxID=6188 RepID=A0AA85G128_9TREM|nr:unnamed protein product [Schistosoma rodhaini]CAH8597286.1 unnamed protein product [Schistosoma rodhaini]